MAHIKQLQKNREFMKQMKRFYSSGPVFFIKFVLWTKETKETWKNNRNFPLRPKTSHAALTPHAPVPKTAWDELFAEKVPRRSLKNENWEFEEEVLTVAEINSETVDYTQRNIKLPDWCY